MSLTDRKYTFCKRAVTEGSDERQEFWEVLLKHRCWDWIQSARLTWGTGDDGSCVVNGNWFEGR